MPHLMLLETEHADHQTSSEEGDCCCSHNSIPEEKGTCQLDQDIDVICETEKDYHSLTCCDSHDHSDLLFQAILLYYSFDLLKLDNISDKIPPYLINYSSADVNQIHGLRAPPFA